MRTNEMQSVNNQKVNKKDAKAAVLAALSNEVTLSKFCKVVMNRDIVPVETYKNLLAAFNLSEDFEIGFNWFVENCPKNNNGDFCKWVKVNGKSVFASEIDEENRETEKGAVYTLLPYNVKKANYSVFLQMFGDVVKEVERKKKEALKARKEAEKAERAAKKEASNEKKAEKAKEKAAKILSGFSAEELAEILQNVKAA